MKKSFALFAIASLGLAPVFCATDAAACPSCKPTEKKQAEEKTMPADKKVTLVCEKGCATTDKKEENKATTTTPATATKKLIADSSKKAEEVCEKCGGTMKDGKCTKCGCMKKASTPAPKIAFA